MTTREFQELVWTKGRELYRDMPWRRNVQPYYVLVSELMLQQTQVDRVIPKFEAFVAAFPTIEALARAPLADVLRLWSGLGYNRRAKFLHEAAQKIVIDYEGEIPRVIEDLLSLPGVGKNTAGAIMAYSFNMPIAFIETNVRTVYFYHFFEDSPQVSDAELLDLVTQTIDIEHPREWYWAIMDYGSFLKRNGAGRIDKSRHYKKQSALKGSLREMRGCILKELSRADVSVLQMRERLATDERFEAAIDGLKRDGLIEETGGTLHLAR